MSIFSIGFASRRYGWLRGLRFAGVFLFVLMVAMQARLQAQTWATVVGSNTKNSSIVPIYTWYTEYPYTQQLYLSSELPAAMANKPISKLSFKFYGQPKLGVWMDIYMVQVPSSVTTLAGGYYTAGLRRVAQSKWIEFKNPSGTSDGVWVDIDLDEPFYWDGSSNIAVSIQQLSLSERLDCFFKCHDKDSMSRTSLNEDATVPLRLTNVPQDTASSVTTVLRHQRPHIRFGYNTCTANNTPFTFPQAVYTVDPGDSFTKPTPSGPAVGDVIYYTSSNPYVASVNLTTGDVSLTGQVGIATITAEWRRSGRCAKFAHYDINVKDNCNTIGTGTTGAMLPFQTMSGYTWAQMLYLGSEIGESNRIHAISFESQAANNTTRAVKIYLGRTAKTRFESDNDFVPLSELTLVYQGNLNIHAGWNRFEFNAVTDYDYDMSDNLVVAVATDLVDANGILGVTRFNMTTTAENTCIAAYTDQWRDMPEPSYYDGHWEEYPTPDDLHEVYRHGNRPNIDICTYNCRLRDGDFRYDATEATHIVGTPFAAPVLTNTTGGTPVFSSSDETLATVAANGAVSMMPNQTGEVIITATIESDATYCANTTQYIIRAREFKTLNYNTTDNCTGTASAAPDPVTGLGMVTLSSEIPSCSGANKVFVKWNTESDGSGDDYYPGGSFPLLHDVTLYAIYGSSCCIADSALLVTYVRNGRARDTLRRSPDGYYNFDLCQHETLTVKVESKDGSGCSFTNPQYKFQYANLYMPVTVMGNEFVPPAPYTATFDSVVGYDLIFSAAVPGCEADKVVMPGRVRVSNGIVVDTVSEDPFTICPGMPSDISVGYVKNAIDFIRVDRSHPQTNAVDGHNDTIFLPDGKNCRRIMGESTVQDCMNDSDPEHSGGCSYISSVNFYQFRESAVVRSNNDIRYLKLNIEHSYIGDLSIQLICPANSNGVRKTANILKLKQYQNADCNCSSAEHVGIGWQSMSGMTQNANAHFGRTVEPENEANHMPSDVAACTEGDRNDPSNKNRPGKGYEYIWACSKDLGYTYTGYTSPATSSSNTNKARVYYKSNQDYVTNDSAWKNSTATSSTADAHKVYIVKPSNSSNMTNIYIPDDEFRTALEGCPFNGEWSIKVQDGYKCDNGWLFSWELALAEDSLRDVWGYNAELDSVWLSCGSWDESTISNDHVTLTPPPGFTGGTVNCDINTVDNFGCHNVSNKPFTFEVRDLILQVRDTLCDCSGEDGKIWIEVPNEYADHQPFTFYLDPVFDPPESINPADMVSYAQGPTPLGRFRDVPYGSNAGWHKVLAIDNYGCPKIESIKVDKNSISAVIAESHNATCYGSANGSFRITASTTQTITGNVFTYTVAGLGSNTTGVFTNVPAGTYSVVITDSYNSCPYTLTPVTIGTDIPPLTLVGDTLQQPLVSGCPLPVGGSYALGATVNGSGTYSYEWRASHDGTPVTITDGTPSGTHTSATIASDASCGTYYDTLIVTETVNHCVDTFTSSFVIIATPPSIAPAAGIDAVRDWGCDPNSDRFTPTAASFAVTDACNPSATATVTAGTETVDGCHHSNTWTANYTNSCGMAATPATIEHAWLETDKPTFDAMPVVAAEAKGSECKYTIPDLTDTVLSRTHGCEASSLRVLEQTPASLTEYLQRADRNDTIDVTVVVRDTCGDTAHAHVRVVIPQNRLVISTNLSTSTNTIDTSACNGYTVATTVTVENPSGTAHSVWTSTPTGFDKTDPAYPLALNPDTNYHVRVTDGNGCEATADVNVALNPDPVITLAAGSGDYEQSLCIGQEITPIKIKLENSSYDPASLGTIAGVAIAVQHHDDRPDTVTISGSPQATGEYTLRALSNQSPACDAKTATIKFNVTDTIVPAIVTSVGGTDGKDTVCVSSATSLTNTAMAIRETAGVSGDIWSWTVDGGTVINGAGTREITVNWATAGDKTVTVTVTHGALNCTSVKSKTIHVQAVPTIDMGSVAGGGNEVTICPNRDTLSFNTGATGTDPSATYTYTYGGDLTFAQQTLDSRDTATIPDVCGVDYRVGVTVADNHGCSVTDSMTVHAVDTDAPVFTLPTNWSKVDTIADGCSLDDLPAAVTSAAGLGSIGVAVEDNCTSNLAQLAVSHRDSNMYEGVTCGYKVRRYYVVEDLCHNKDSIYKDIFVQFPTGAPDVALDVPVVQATAAGNCQYIIQDLATTAIAQVTGHCGRNDYLRVTYQSDEGLHTQNSLKNDTLTVTLRVKDTCSAEAEVTVKVVVPQDTLAFSTNLSLTSNTIDTAACVGNSVATTVTVLHPNGSEHIDWTSTPAGFTRTDPSYPLALHSGNPDTTYQAVLVDGNGCTDTATIHVALNPSPVITPLPGHDRLTQSICLGDSIDTVMVKIEYATFDPASSIASAERVTVQNIHHDDAPDTLLVFGNPADTGSYTLRVLSDQSPACESDEVSLTFNVADTVKPSIVTVVGGTEGKDTVCISSTGSLTNSEMTISETSAMVGDSYVWDVDGGTVTGGDGPRQITVAWTSSGDKTVTVHVTRGACTSTATKQIYVQAVPVPALDNAASSAYDLATDTYTICPNRDTLSFSTTLTGAVAGTTYSYTYGGDGVTFVQQTHDSRDTATIPHTCGVDYRVGVTVADNHGCSVADSLTVSVIDTTAPVVTAPGGGKSLVEDDIDGCTSNLNILYPAMTTAEELIAEGVAMSDNCVAPAALMVSHRDSVFASVTCGYKVRRYYIVADSCGNRDSIYQDINVHIPPHSFTVSSVATSADVNCLSDVRDLHYNNSQIHLPLVQDGCGHTITVLDSFPASTMTGRTCMDTTVFTYTYRDCEAHDTTWSFTYNVTLPRLALPDTTRLFDTLPCVSTAHNATNNSPNNPTLTDACGRTVAASPADEHFVETATSEPIDDINLDGTGTVTYNWVYEDCSGRRYVWQRVHVIVPDAFSAYPNDSITVGCSGQIVMPATPVREVCDEPVVFEPPFTESAPDYTISTDKGCYAITYSIGYTVFDQHYTYNYVYVYNPPDFTIPDDDVVITSVHCIADTVAPTPDMLPVVTHNYSSGDVGDCATGLDDTIHATGPDRTIKSNGCKDTVVYTYYYSDCRQTKEWHYTYIIAPHAAPHEVENELTHSYADNDGEVECFADATAITGEANLPVIVSECGDTIATPVPTYADTLTAPGALTGTRTWHYLYEDCAGNQFDWTYVYTVVRHTAPYELPTDPSDPTSFVDTVAYVDCDTMVVRPTMPTVTDVCGNPVQPAADSSIVRTDHNCRDTVTYYYNYYDPTDASLVYNWYFRYYIDKAQTPTVVQGFSPDHDTVSCFSDAVRPTQVPVVVDACGEQLSPAVDSVDTHTSSDPLNCTGYRTFNYVYTDCSGTKTVTLNYTRYVEHPELVVPQNDTVSYTCVNAAMDYRPQPDTLTNACGDVIVADSIDRTSTLNAHDSGYVSYHYSYTDCDGREYDWYYVCDVRPAEFVEPVDSTRTVNCLAQATVPTAEQYPDIEECGIRIPQDRPWDSGPVSTYSVDFNDTCGAVTYTYTYTIHGKQYDWSFVYTIEPPEFSIPSIDTDDTIECYDVNNPAMQPMLPVVINSCGDTINSSLTNPPTLVIDSSDYVAHNYCSGNIVYTYTYADCGGNTLQWSFTHVVLPTTVPHEVENPVTHSFAVNSGTTECFADADTIRGDALPVILSQCGDTLSPSLVTAADTMADAAHDTVTGTRTYHYIYSDCAGNDFDWTYIYTVVRTTSPTQVPDGGAPEVAVEAHVNCDTLVVRPTLPRVVDVCGGVLLPYADSSIVRTSHDCKDTVTYYYNYYDPSDRDLTDDQLVYRWSFTYYVDKAVMPTVVQDFSPDHDTVSCFADAVRPAQLPVVVDACGEQLTPAIDSVDTHTGGNDANCTGDRTFRYTYTDCSGEYTLTLTYTRYVEHPELVVPQNDTVSYICVNAAMDFCPQPDTLTNACGDMIIADSIGRTSTLNAHDSGYVSYHYRYTDCDGREYDWYYVCDVRPAEFVAPIDSTRTVNCLAQATVPTAEQYPDIEDCGIRIPQDQPWDSGEYPDTAYSVDYNDTCGVVTYTYRYTVHGQQYTWSYIYTIEPPEFTFPSGVATSDTVECYDVNAPEMQPTLPVVINSCGDTINSSSNPPTLVIDSSDYVAHDRCHGNVVYNYTYTDCGGNTLVWQFTHVVHHTTAPHIVGSEPATAANVACFADATETFDVPAVADVCGRPIARPDAEVTRGGTNCDGWVNYKYTFIDCDNVPFEWNFRYTVHDTVAPHIDATALLSMAESQPVAHGNCQYSMPNLHTAVLDATSDVASQNCESTVFFVEQTPDFTVLFRQPLADSTVTVRLVVRDTCDNRDTAYIDIVIPGSQISVDAVSLDDNGQFAQNAVICAGQSINLQAQSTTSNGEQQYVWTPTEGLSAVAGSEAVAAPSQTVTYTVTFTDANGCTASDNIEVTVHQLTSTAFTEVACDIFVWDNHGETFTYSQGDTYIHEYLTADGCTSYDTLYLTVNHNSSTNYVVDDVCDRYEWNGVTYVNDGVYTSPIYYTPEGCPSMDTLTLTLLHNTSAAYTEAACDTYTWLRGNQTFAESGTYYYSYNNDAGCPSVDTLYLTVHHSSVTNLTATACDHYEWYGQQFGQSAQAEHTLADRYGCDSLLRLDVTIYYSDNYSYGDTICAGERYHFFDQTLTESGTYENVIRTVHGCDSTISLYLLVVPRPAVRIGYDYDCDAATYTLTAATTATAFQWHSVPNVEGLSAQATERTITVSPTHHTLFAVLAGYDGLMQCAVSDTISLNPVSVVDAQIEVTPTALYRELLDWSAVNGTQTETWHQWYVDGIYYGDENQISGTASDKVDSVVLVLIAGSDQCTDTARVVLPMLREGLFVPNVFTPDLKINRKFGAVGTGIIRFEMDIYNRSGVHVFHSDNIHDWWDGSHNGIPCTNGAYVYHIVYSTEVFPDVKREVAGQVMLLR